MTTGKAFTCAGMAMVFVACLGINLRIAPAATTSPTTFPTMTDEERASIVRDGTRNFGDAPDDDGPMAADLSSALKSADVLKAVKKVGDWELARHEKNFGLNWCWGALYTGMMSASRTTGDPKYHDAMLRMAEKAHWRLQSGGLNSSDDLAVGQTFLELYLEQPNPDVQRIAFTRTSLDALITAPPPRGRTIPWWWCDALYMGPGVWTRLYKATGDAKYIEFMNKNWWITSDLLYNKDEHLYARDATFKDRKEANGKPMFWSRGEGWVMGGFTRVIPFLPADYPDRAKYIQQFKEMSERIAALQGEDGLWRSGMLDPDTYVLPENSGGAFFTEALAWGINEGYLDKARYQPVVEKAWKGLLSHVYATGRLGCIQQTGAAPAHFKPTSSYCYGVGAFLLAGGEVNRLALSNAK